MRRSVSSKLGVSILDSSKRTVLMLTETIPRLLKQAQLLEAHGYPQKHSKGVWRRGGSQRLEARPVGKAKNTREEQH